MFALLTECVFFLLFFSAVLCHFARSSAVYAYYVCGYVMVICTRGWLSHDYTVACNSVTCTTVADPVNHAPVTHTSTSHCPVGTQMSGMQSNTALSTGMPTIAHALSQPPLTTAKGKHVAHYITHSAGLSQGVSLI